jgi:hypothetical protein
MSASIGELAVHHPPESTDEGRPTPTSRSALREAIRRDLEAARRALGRFRGAFSVTPPASQVHDVTRTVPSDALVARFLHGLKREQEVVLGPLLDRLEAFGLRLTAEHDIPPQPIEEGIALVDQYLTHLHDSDLRLLAAAGSDASTTEAARLTLSKLAADYEHSRVRWATVRVMLRGYELKLGYYRAMIGLTLAQECRAERAWHDFAEAYARTSIPHAFSPEVADIWRHELERSQTEGRAQRARIAQYIQDSAHFLTDPPPKETASPPARGGPPVDPQSRPAAAPRSDPVRHPPAERRAPSRA